MLKKSLIAIALASVSTVATAGTVTTSNAAPIISVEGYALASDKVIKSKNGWAATTDVVIEADTAYVSNDVVVLTIANGTFNTDATLTVATTGSTTTTDASFLDYQNPTTIRLRLGDAIPKDGTIVISGVEFTPTSAADEDEVKMSSYVLSSNATIGTYDKGDAAVVATFAQQYKLGTISKLNGQVSTGKGRQEFTGTDNLEDALSVPVTIETVNALAIDDTLSTTEVSYVLAGADLSFAADYDLKANGGNADGKLSDTELKKAFVISKPSAGTLSINEAYTELTVKDTSNATDGLALDVTVIGNAKGGSELAAPQSFNVTANVKTANGSFTVKGLDSAAVGGWSLDGSTGDVKYLPFGSIYAQSITVTNSGSVVGEITAEIFFKGEKYSTTLEASAAANSVTDISKAVSKFAAESGVDGDARVRITVNAPNCTVNAVYFHKGDADRVLVPVTNSQ